MIAANRTVPLPQQNEAEGDYIVRAHAALMQAMPEPMERNRAIWSTWDSYRGNPERDRAETHFPPEQFEHKRDVCLWFEHEAVASGEDGQPVVKKNDLNRLRSIVDENNHRIADTDAYTALVDKHTLRPGSDDAGKRPPRTIGYVGPFRLGMIGRVNPRYAIFGDEHHRKDCAEVLKDRQRRSVEVLTLRANGRSYLDPIAALSEAPRLPLPVQFSADSGDAVIERYETEDGMIERYEAVAAFPGGGNTYIPGAGDRRRKSDKEQFGAADASPSDDPQPASGAMDEQQIVKQIIDAMMATPQMQFLNQLMQESGGQVDQPPGADPQAGQMPGQPGQPGQQEPYGSMPPQPQPQPQPQPPAMPGQNVQPYGMNRYSADDSDDLELETYEADEMSSEVTAEQYAALVESNQNMMEQLTEVRQQNAVMAAKAADAERSQRINELYQAYPHMIDREDEFDRCLYSHGSTMDDDRFEDHIDMVESMAKRAPMGNSMVPSGEMPADHRPRRDTVERQRYEAQVQERSTEIYSAAISRGEFLTAEQAWAQAEQEIG